MAQKALKSLATTLGICSLLIFLGGCSKQDESALVNLSVQDQDQATTESQQSSFSSGEILGQSPIQNTQKLVINNGCIGCGRCARVAVNTFSFQGEQAQVISQKYVSDAAVQQAIRECPVSAIQIIEV